MAYIMKMDNIRIYITESCNAKCPNCFNRTNRTSNYIDKEHFESICQYFSANGIKNIKIMGGEPTIHPDFKMFTEIAQKYFGSVSVFTNAINDGICEFAPRESDSIVYNFRFSKFLNKSKLLLGWPGRRSLEVQITTKTDRQLLIDQLSKFKDHSEFLNPCLTLDCTENIFEHRDALVELYEDVWEYCRSNGFIMGQDHLIPFCFVKGSNIPVPRGGSVCQINCAGLIDASYNIKFCNQFIDESIPLIQNGDLIPFEKYEAFLKAYYEKMNNTVMSKGCSKCAMNGVLCNGGCFVAKGNVTEDNIRHYRLL